MELTFWKYQGTGNDFVMVDGRTTHWEQYLSTTQIRFLCDRRFGIGADGLIILAPAAQADFRMVYFNADGNESTMCGNGGRCLVAFAHQLGITQETYTFEAIDGLHHAGLIGELVELEMTPPQGFRTIGDQTFWIDTGSPHYVRFLVETLDDWPVFVEGKSIRYAESFAPGGTNVNFVNVLGTNQLRVRTYERGVEDETLSCGTGVTACAYIYALQHNVPDTSVQIQTEGGPLSVRIESAGQEGQKVILTGPAQSVFYGQISLPPA